MLEMLAKDPDSNRTGCPSIYADKEAPGYCVVQAPQVDDTTAAGMVNVLPGEVGSRIKEDVLLAAADAIRARRARG